MGTKMAPTFTTLTLAYLEENIYKIKATIRKSVNPGSNTPQDTNCTATCPLSRKLFKLDKPDMQDTAGEAEMNS